MTQSWPLLVGSHELIPVHLTWGGANTVHLAEQSAPGDDGIEAVPGETDADDVVLLRSAEASLKEGAPVPVPEPQTRTLCGRPRGPMAQDPALDLLGRQRGLLCGSCWRSVEGWLQPPSPGAGEDDVVAWIVATVLEIGEAMLDAVPVPRLEAVRRRVRSEIKAAIGGSVRTSKIGESTLWVHSGLVADAKTPERWQAEMRAAAERVWAVQDGRPVEPVSWRRRWSEIAAAE